MTLTLEGDCLVLRDTYAASSDVAVGDSLRLTGPRRAGPTVATDDYVVGIATRSARQGEPLTIAIAGRVRCLAGPAGIVKFRPVGPSATAGRAANTDATTRAFAYGVSLEDAAAGRPFWVHLRGLA